MFYPPEGLLGSMVLFPFYWVREVCLTFNLLAEIRRFEILKMLYPPEEFCGAEPEGGPIVFTFHFIGVG